jgi:hypothetical protein
MSNQTKTETGTPSAFPLATGSRFRLLCDTDTIKIGDELLLDDAETWERIDGGPSVAEHWIIGRPYSTVFFQPMRRAANAKDQPRAEK